MKTTTTIGLILCGGKSSRMGQDKGLIPTDGTNWAGKLKLLLKQVGIEQVYLSVSAHNKDHYLKHFHENCLITDLPFSNTPSALVGLLSAYQVLKKQTPHFSIFVLACDLQNLDETVIRLVMEQAQKSPAIVHLLSDGDFWQPLAGIYSNTALEKLVTQSQSSSFENKSVMRFVKPLTPNVILLSEEEKVKLANFNSPADLKQ